MTTIRFSNKSTVDQPSLNNLEFDTVYGIMVSHELDVSVIRDEDCIKVLVGSPNAETYRYWVYADGEIFMTEQRETITAGAYHWIRRLTEDTSCVSEMKAEGSQPFMTASEFVNQNKRGVEGQFDAMDIR